MMLLIVIYSLWIYLGLFVEGKLICSPDRTNGRCQWTLFRWNKSDGCGYKQKQNEHFCIMKTFDGSKSIFLTKINLSSNQEYCLQFKYLITGPMLNSCMHFYAKSSINVGNGSKLFSTFCIPYQQSVLQWYSFNVFLPSNITMINAVTESNGLAHNQVLIIKELSIQLCDRSSILSNEMNSTIGNTSFINPTNFSRRYRWIIFFILITIFVIILGLFISKFYRIIIHRQSTITERIQISPVNNLSQHFYEEPISFILPSTIDISVYDHTKKSPKVTTLTVPDRAKKRQAKSPAKSNLSTASNKSSKVPSPIPAIAVHNPSSSTVIASDDIRSSTDLVNSSTLSPNQRTPPESTIIVNKLSDDLKSLWDLDELNRFTRDMFKYSGKSIHNETKQRSHRPRLNCAKDQDQNLEKYIQSRTHCIDVFDEYVSTLEQQHGFIRSAATDQPVFDPAISITGPDIKKDPTAVDREDSRVMKKLTKMEPRKKYALIHEQVGIFIIGGYNLFTKIPIQREPETDYLFKFSGGVTKIPPLQPCRANFAIYTDGNDIYVAGGQTIDNELLDDVQRLNIKKLKWEHITTLTGPIAACGMTVDENRIYLAGGYDILVGETNFLSDYTIYDMSIKKLESASDLPTPRCRSLVFVCDKAVFCISGLIEGRNENHNKKLKISTDILKWTRKMPLWIKVSQTPELTKFHALSFNQPYLEITKRFLNEEGAETKTIMEAHYDFRTNTWANGRAPSDSKPSSPRAKKSPKSKSKSPSKPSKKKKSKKKSK